MTTPRLIPAVALLLAIAGCAGTGTSPAHVAASAPAARPSATGSYQDQVMAWGRRFAACARAHGQPDFPDPVYPADAQPSGLTWGFHLFDRAGKPALGQATQVCADVTAQVPPAPDALKPPSATTLAQMRQYAQCMRQHGMSDFPDPKADGTFPILNTPYEGIAPLSPKHPSQAVGDADHACRVYQIDWDIRAS